MAATGLVQFDGSNWVIWDTENSAIPTNYLNSVVVDDANRIWIATEDAGLLVLERNAVGWMFYRLQKTLKYIPIQPMISCSCIRPMVHRLTGNYITTRACCAEAE